MDILSQLKDLAVAADNAKAEHEVAVKEVGQAERRAEKKRAAAEAAQKTYDAAKAIVEKAIGSLKIELPKPAAPAPEPEAKPEAAKKK